MFPSFTVIISVYAGDRPDWFESALESIVHQTVPPTQIIITRDGLVSDELTSTISKAMVEYVSISFVLISTEFNIGRGKILGKAVDRAATDYIAIMDSDDISLENRFERQLSVFMENSSIDVVGTWIDEYERLPGKKHVKRKVPEKHSEIVTFAKWRNPVNQMTVMFKKKSVLSAGNYQSINWFEDMWLWCRMIMDDFRFYNIQESLVIVRGGREMIKRRSGLKYAVSEASLLTRLYKLGFYSPFQYYSNLAIRIPARFLPLGVLYFALISFLRK